MIKKILGICIALGLLTSFSVFAINQDDCKTRGNTSSYGVLHTGANYREWVGQNPTDGKCVCKPSNDNCCGISLYTNVPFVGKCIEYGGSTISGADGSSTVVTPVNAFPVLLGAMSKILLSVILIVCFGAIVVAGVMVSYGNPEGGRKLIEHVVIAMALLGASGVILRLVNPNFFQ